MHQCEEKDVYLQKIGIYDKRDQYKELQVGRQPEFGLGYVQCGYWGKRLR